MKIAFIGQKGIPTKTGGVERYVENLAVNMVKAGHEVTVYSRSSYNTEKLKEWNGIRIITTPTIASKNLDAIISTFFACLDLIRRRYDIIHIQSIGPGSLLWLAKLLKPRTRVVFTFHCQDYYHKKWGRFAKWYLKFGEAVGNRLGDKVFTVSKSLAQYAKDNYGADALCIPSSAQVSPLAPADEITKNWGLTKDSYLVSIGRLIRHKGIHYLIKAYKELKTDKKLVIVGDGSFTDDYVNELKSLAADNENIIFTGNQTGQTLKELYSNAAIFIQPSESEGLSFALIEAMSYARPCVVSNIDSNREGLSTAGVYFEDRNYQDLRDKLQTLLNEPTRLAAFGNAALERVKKEYEAGKITQDMLTAYQEVLNKKRTVFQSFIFKKA
ncbi:MAG: glycosyltransferase family 4 protein [Patescibacteria group bacterium]